MIEDVRAALQRAPLKTLPRRAYLRYRYGRSSPDATYLEAKVLNELRHRPAAPLRETAPPTGALDVAFVIPPFQRGSGGHTTLSNIVRALEARGHRCSFWLDDPGARMTKPDEAAADFRAWFGPFAADVHASLAGWRGADVAVATGYQTVFRVRTLPDAGARAYLVQDHEPEFFATSAERLHAEESYRFPLHAITAGNWLADVMRDEHGLGATPFELGVDHSIYVPHPEEQRLDDVVIVYARATTPRRAVPIALAAMGELKRRRPRTEVWLYGQEHAPRIDFPITNLGVVNGVTLSRHYARATVGLCLSLTNYSLVPQEMLACELPCVEADMPSPRAEFGTDGPIVLARPEPNALADAVERLLDDPGERRRRAAEGRDLALRMTWDAAAEKIESGLRRSLEERAG